MDDPKGKVVLQSPLYKKASEANTVGRKTMEINTLKLRHFHDLKISVFFTFFKLFIFAEPSVGHGRS